MCNLILNTHPHTCRHIYNTHQIIYCTAADARTDTPCKNLRGIWRVMNHFCRACRHDPAHEVWSNKPDEDGRLLEGRAFEIEKVLVELEGGEGPDGVPMGWRSRMDGWSSRARARGWWCF